MKTNTKVDSIFTWNNYTIDLKAIIAKDYLESKKTDFQRLKEKAFKFLWIAGIIWFIVVSFFGWGIFSTEANADNSYYCLVAKDRWADTDTLTRNGCIQESKIEAKDSKQTLKWNNRLYNVEVHKDRIQTMKDMWLSDTRILDLLAILNMECGNYTGKCFNGNDIWPFQINKIHKKQYHTSWMYYDKQDWGRLFTYQLQYANKLVESYEQGNCKPEYIEKYWVGETYNQKRWRCIAFHYNGHPKYKFAYNKLGWERRELIKQAIYENLR